MLANLDVQRFTIFWYFRVRLRTFFCCLTLIIEYVNVLWGLVKSFHRHLWICLLKHWNKHHLRLLIVWLIHVGTHILYGIHWLPLLHLTLSFRWCSLNPNFTVGKLPIVKWINQTRSSDFPFVWHDRQIYLLSVKNRILPGGGCYFSSEVFRLIVLVW